MLEGSKKLATTMDNTPADDLNVSDGKLAMVCFYFEHKLFYIY